MAKVGINGFGRIGRLVLRAALEKATGVHLNRGHLLSRNMLPELWSAAPMTAGSSGRAAEPGQQVTTSCHLKISLNQKVGSVDHSFLLVTS